MEHWGVWWRPIAQRSKTFCEVGRKSEWGHTHTHTHTYQQRCDFYKTKCVFKEEKWTKNSVPIAQKTHYISLTNPTVYVV
jgi:hypothetical protein